MKTAIITGANRGVGLGIARILHQNDFKIVSLNRTRLMVDWMDEIICDLTDEVSIRSGVEQAANILDHIDLLICNAGVRRLKTIKSLTLSEWHESFLVNVTGPFLILQALFDHLCKSQGTVFFIGSHAWNHSFIEGAAYSSSKAAFKALADTAMADLRNYSVRVCHISLGAISNRKMPNDEWKLTPDDVGRLVVALYDLPKRCLPNYINMRPLKNPDAPTMNMSSLQYL